MKKPTSLSDALVGARTRFGYTIREAADAMATTTYQQIYYWEGRRNDREAPETAASMPLSIAFELSQLYRPFLSLEELYKISP